MARARCPVACCDRTPAKYKQAQQLMQNASGSVMLSTTTNKLVPDEAVPALDSMSGHAGRIQQLAHLRRG